MRKSSLYLFSGTLFIVTIADAIISFWAPNLIQVSFYNNPFYMGLVISFQSVVGIAADIIFPTLLKKASIKKLVLLSILISAAAIIFLFSSSLRPIIILFLVSMAAWGIYYELSNFANSQFVSSIRPEDRTSTWGLIGILKSLAYFIGPFLAVWLLLIGNYVAAGVGIILLIFAFILYSFKNKNKNEDIPLSIDVANVKPFQELKYWLTLSKTIWPVILMSLVIGFIDATFWTTGAVWTEKLARMHPVGGLLLALYMLPSIFVGIAITKWKISSGKKRLSQLLMLVGGIILSFIAINNSVFYILFVVLLSSIFISVSYPLLEATYSDIADRLGKEKKHVVGLTASVINLSYIIWPPLAGLITKSKGEQVTFMYVGVLTALISLVLLTITPKKLKLPQEEIKDWKD